MITSPFSVTLTIFILISGDVALTGFLCPPIMTGISGSPGLLSTVKGNVKTEMKGM